jgi:uncharacterized protein (TIGR03435 family)
MAVAVLASAQGQTRVGASPTFEVASVKPAVPRPGAGRGGCPQSFSMDRGRVEIRCATVATLIGYAFRLPSRVTKPTGPALINGPERYNIEAKLPPDSSENQVPEMLQALLADRFQLAIHRTTAEQEVYALVVAKTGPKLTEANPDVETAPADDPGTVVAIGGIATRMTRGPNGYTITNPRIGTVKHTEDRDRNSRWDAPSTTLEGLADLLQQVGPLSADVKDMTGIKGRYQVTLEISLKDGVAPLPPEARGDRAAMEAAIMDMENAMVRSMNRELQKLGLQLVRRKEPVETLVVDRVEKPSGN